ncbi:cellulase-domain-containing protein [Anaeromyces robustus]|uniref:Cellulase-domain-containing protein n=1 Tax=Anaeromyces robustus TaxID=1754192 RepID=A0A1Y1WPG1_9FUNG|nr:cellulase-domain-containing protein [Anaeromyces robustus]|eukprot:ORX75146.1 cellulase-domain-containing protein [Anaeromyces robustus]
MKFINTLALIGLAIIGSNAMQDIPSKDLVKKFNIGWNLGNTLDAHCLEFLDYSEDQTASETCWENPRATQELFNKLNSAGFDIFRIPTTWTGHFGDGPEYKIDDAWMKRVHEVVQYAINTGAYAILNIHHENWNYAFSNNLETAKVVLEAIWKQIATEFEEYDEHLIFEGMNEPRKVDTDVEWNGGDQEGWDFVNEMNELFIKTVRATGGNNKLRHLMIPTYAAAVNEHTLEGFKYPNDDDKVIVSVHSYTPYEFALATDDTAYSVFNNTQPIEWAMNNIKTYFRDKDIPVILGEFGAMNRNNEEDRQRWAETFVSSARAIGVPCVLWDNGVFEGDGERFGIIDRNKLTITYPLLLKGLMAGVGKTVNISDEDQQQQPQQPSIEPPTAETPTIKPPPSVTPPSTVAPPNIEPPTVEPPTVEPPTVEPPTVEPPTVTPPNVEPPTVEPPTVSPPNVEPPTVEPPTVTPPNVENDNDYLSCAKDDNACKSKKSEECYKKVSECWITQQDQSKCNELSNTCSKIWN